MRTTGLVSLAILPLLICGCAKKAPECSSPEVTNLVKKLAAKHPDKFDEEPDTDRMTMSAIRVQSFDEDTGKYTCEAELRMAWSSGLFVEEPPTYQVSYTSELTEKDGEFYVSMRLTRQ